MRILKGYELNERIGTGGFGEVYRAYQAAIERTVAIKVILPEHANQAEFIQRFEIEAQLIARLEHPYIVPLYDYWRDPDGAYLVMRYLSGGNLANKILMEENISLNDAATMLGQIAGALHAAHQKQIVHQDIKPANILMDDQGFYYLTDFGIARDLVGDVNLAQDPNDILHGSPTYISPEHLKRGDITAKADIYSLGILMYEVLTGEAPFDGEMKQVLKKHLQTDLPPLRAKRADLPDALDDVLKQATLKNPVNRYDTALDFARDFQQVVNHFNDADGEQFRPGAARRLTTSSLDPADVYNPYKGLRAFEEADAAEFFGRDELIDTLIRRMIESVDYQRFLAVMGPSGSGKSSVVRAGLLPAIREGDLMGLPSTFVTTITPGEHPMRKLEGAILSVATTADERLLNELHSGDYDLHTVLQRVLPSSGDMVLFIDQFEELFTLTSDDDERMTFLDQLYRALTRSDSRLRVIVTLRADFFDRPLALENWGAMFKQRNEVVLPMSPDNLRLVIREPANRAGLILEPGLVDLIIDDMGKRDSALPLLQYTLTELYESKEGLQLTIEAYRDLGGVSGALAKRAEETFKELSEARQTIARRIFPRLVRLGEGTEDTSRRALVGELRSLDPDADTVQAVLDHFGDRRLLTFDRESNSRAPTVQIAHEALLRSWQRLREWLNQNRDALRAQARLRRAANDWIDADLDESFLATGARLEQFRSLRGQDMIALSDDERAYLRASIDRAERAKRRRERTYVLIATLAIIIAFGALVTVALRQQAIDARNRAVSARATAVAEANIAQSRELAASARNQLNDTDTALLLSEYALSIDDTFEARNSLFMALQTQPAIAGYYYGHTDALRTLAVSPDGTRMVSGGRDATLIVWDTQTRQPLRRLDGHTNWINDVAFSPDGNHILSGSRDGTAILWDTESGEEQWRVVPFDADTAREEAIRSVAFAPDGETIATLDSTGALIIWDAESSEEINRVQAHDELPYALAYSPDGTRIATGSSDATARLWDAETLDSVATFSGHDDWVMSVQFSPNGDFLATGSADNSVLVWDVDTEQATLQLPANDWVRTLTFVDDDRLISADNRGNVYQWNLADQVLQQSFQIATGVQIWDIALTDNRILTATTDPDVQAWRRDDTRPLMRILGTDTDRVTRIAVAPDGNQVASANESGSIRLWDADTGDATVLDEHTDTITALAYSDHRLLSVDATGRAILWDDAEPLIDEDYGDSFAAAVYDKTVALAEGDTIRIFDIDGTTLTDVIMLDDAHDSRVTSLAFSPDGSLLASGSLDASVRLWDTTDYAPHDPLEGHDSGIASLAFSPDGQLLASGSRDTTIRLWSVSDQSAYRETLTGHENWVSALAFSPDGRWLASGSLDRQILLWDTALFRPLGMPLTGHNDWVTGLAFAPDSDWLASSSNDATIRLWETQVDAWRRLACEITSRSLTTDEVQRYFSVEGNVPDGVCDPASDRSNNSDENTG